MNFDRLNGRQFERFSDFIYQKCGIRIDEKKVTLLSNRVRRRLKATGLNDFDAYYKFLASASGTSELQDFLDAITTNETFFFRTPKQFDWLETVLLPTMIAEHIAGRRPPSLRFWSAGCSTGAEPYSIAIKLLENAYRLRDWSLQILGTDLSEEALRDARQGEFTARLVDAVTERQRRRFFQQGSDGNHWQIRSEAKQLIEFRGHNLMRPLREHTFDCVFIRNVLIYFDRESKQVVINNILNALADGGYLVVGPSEGVYDMLQSLRKISPLIYQKVDAPRTSAIRTAKSEKP